jgi:anaerobic glycerol-3-phosphate dehydrogenase
MKDWTAVYKSPIHSRAEIVKGILSEHGIDAVIVNKKDSTIHIDHGQVEVLVHRNQVLNAMQIINGEITFK